MKEKTNKSKSKNKTANTAKAKVTKENSLKIFLVLAGLMALTVVVFFPMLQNQFTGWDDPSYITKNSHIWKLNAENLKYIFTQPIALNYHPLTMLSLAINYSFSQLNPYSYYLTNLIIHLCNVGLVFWFIYLLSQKNIHVAALTALIFAIHPMHVESVAWAAERKDVLYTFFFIAALITYMMYQDTKKQLYYFITIILALGSLLSKPAAIVFPLVLILLDYYRNADFKIKSLTNKIPFFILSGIFIYMTLIAQTMDNFDVGHYRNYSIPQRFLFACYGFMIYIVKLLIPFKLAAFHPYPQNIGPLFYLAPLVNLILIIGLFFWKAQRKLLVFGMLFYFVNLMLVLQFYSVGDALIGERYTYIPYIGLVFMLGMILFNSEIKINRNIIWGILGVGCAVLAVTANARVKVWNNTETLWTDMIEKYPESDRGYYDRGNYYSRLNEQEKAVADYSKAIEAGTDYRSYNNRGQAYFKLQKYEEAIRDYSSTIALEPTKFKPFLNRGYAWFKLQKFDEAIKDMTQAIHLEPNYDTYYFRATVYIAMQDYEKAIADYKMASQFTKEVTIYGEIGNAYFAIKNFPSAIEQYSTLLNQNPNNTSTLYNRGAAYFQINKIDEAITDLEKAVALDPNNARNYTLLATLYEKKGNNIKAAENTAKANKLNAGKGQ